MAPKEVSWPNLPYPTNRDKDLVTVDSWIEGKKVDDGAEGLWRIHDGLYDLSKYMQNHPGGVMWLEITKGTDVTEAFESHHITNKAENMLPNFYVRPAKTPRNSPYTCQPNGFYKTIKAKVNRYFGNKSPEPTLQSRLMLDTLVVLSLFTAVLASKYNSYYLATLAGILLDFVVHCGHNFVHMRDNWRMYYYYLTTFSVREWRISHCLSHHIYTNTIQDLEMSLFEPLFQFRPESNKSFSVRYLSWIYFPFVLSIITFMQIYKRIHMKVFTKYDLIMFGVPTLMLLGGNLSFVSTMLMWSWIVMITGFSFGAIGFTAAHHHPDIFHDGDVPRKDGDWGLQQLDAVQDRVEIRGSVYVGLLIFGEHTLHHPFPTLDHGLLPQLTPIFEETLDEFGLKWNMNTVCSLLLGTFKQLARIEKNQIGAKPKRN